MTCTSRRPVGLLSRWLLALAVSGLAAASALSAPPKPDPGDRGIKLPAGFHAVVFADALGPLRHVAVAPNGDVYVKTRKAGIIGLRDTNGDGRADLKEPFGDGGGTGIAVHDGYLYHSSNTAVSGSSSVPSSTVRSIPSGLKTWRFMNVKNGSPAAPSTTALSRIQPDVEKRYFVPGSNASGS